MWHVARFATGSLEDGRQPDRLRLRRPPTSRKPGQGLARLLAGEQRPRDVPLDEEEVSRDVEHQPQVRIGLDRRPRVGGEDRGLVKLGDRPVAKDVMQSILGFFAVYLGVFVAASFIMAGVGMDLTSASASVIATLSNIGPGLGSVGPTDNFAHVPAFGKLVLAFCMLLERL